MDLDAWACSVNRLSSKIKRYRWGSGGGAEALIDRGRRLGLTCR